MPVGGVPKHLVKTLTRAKFEALAHNLIQACLEPCTKAMSDAGLGNSAIDEVILVGGSSRIPAVQKLVEDFFGKVPSQGVNPDEVVAVGAAVQGAVLTDEIKGVVLLDVTPLSMGIETMGGVCLLYTSYLFIYMNTRQKYHKLIDKTNKLWIKTNLYTDKLLFK